MILVTRVYNRQDYDRLHSFLSHFDQLATAMAVIQFATPDHQLQIFLAQAEVGSAKGAALTEAKKRLRELSDVKALAKQFSSAGNDHLGAIKDVIGEFRSGVFEIVVPSSTGTFAFRSVLDTKWLRVTPERLRALYGGHSSFAVTILGQVTYFPCPPAKVDISVPDSRPDENLDEDAEDQQTPPSEGVSYDHSNIEEELGAPESAGRVGGHIRNLVNLISMMEKAFLESEGSTDVIIRPIAIYREASFE